MDGIFADPPSQQQQKQAFDFFNDDDDNIDDDPVAGQGVPVNNFFENQPAKMMAAPNK